MLYSTTANLICIDFYVYFPKTAQSTALVHLQLVQQCRQIFFPLSLWHNRWQQTTPFQRKDVARSIHVAKHFANRFANKWSSHFAFLKVNITNILIKIAHQHSTTSQKLQSTVLMHLEVLCKNRYFGNFQITVKALSDDRGKRFRGSSWLP